MQHLPQVRLIAKRIHDRLQPLAPVLCATRNQIAHEPDFKLKRDLAERALGIYETALKNLGVLG